MNLRPLRQSGFSLLELMLALGIGVLLMAAIYAGYNSRRSEAEISVMDADMDSLIYKANMAYAGSFQFATTGGTTVPVSAQRLNDAAGGLPSAFIPDATSISGYRHFWGAPAIIGAASTDGGVTLDLLTVQLNDIAPDECIDLVGRLAPRMYDTFVDGNLVGLTPARTAASQGRFNIRVEQVAPLCAQDQNDILFRFLKPLNYSMFRSLPVTPTFTPGSTPQSDEQTAIQAHFTRVEAAMTARETAQVALP